jgi:hypothetical protein
VNFEYGLTYYYLYASVASSGDTLNTNIAKVQIRNEYRKFFSGLIYTELEISQTLKLPRDPFCKADILNLNCLNKLNLQNFKGLSSFNRANCPYVIHTIYSMTVTWIPTPYFLFAHFR